MPTNIDQPTSTNMMIELNLIDSSSLLLTIAPTKPRPELQGEGVSQEGLARRWVWANRRCARNGLCNFVTLHLRSWLRSAAS